MGRGVIIVALLEEDDFLRILSGLYRRQDSGNGERCPREEPEWILSSGPFSGDSLAGGVAGFSILKMLLHDA